MKADSDLDPYVKLCSVCRAKKAAEKAQVTVPSPPEGLIPIDVPGEDEDFAEELPEPLTAPRVKVVHVPEVPFEEEVPCITGVEKRLRKAQ